MYYEQNKNKNKPGNNPGNITIANTREPNNIPPLHQALGTYTGDVHMKILKIIRNFCFLTSSLILLFMIIFFSILSLTEPFFFELEKILGFVILFFAICLMIIHSENKN